MRTHRYVRANVACVRACDSDKLGKIEKELNMRRSVINEYERIMPGSEKAKAYLECRLGECVMDTRICKVSLCTFAP